MMRMALTVAVLALALFTVPGVSAEPDPPTCHDRGPIVNGGVVQVWLTRDCQPKLVVNEPTCRIDDLALC